MLFFYDVNTKYEPFVGCQLFVQFTTAPSRIASKGNELNQQQVIPTVSQLNDHFILNKSDCYQLPSR